MITTATHNAHYNAREPVAHRIFKRYFVAPLPVAAPESRRLEQQERQHARLGAALALPIRQMQTEPPREALN
jgi:hypothetical protein